jgi:hypothetical protein
MIKDPASEMAFKSWPITIEYPEDQYRWWSEDLTSLCWNASEVRELGSEAIRQRCIRSVAVEVVFTLREVAVSNAISYYSDSSQSGFA